MISSMTGFARRVEETRWGEMTWSLRSLNHRSLDISIQMPERFRPLEAQFRRRIVESFSRGRVDAFLLFSRAVSATEKSRLDESVLQSLMVYAEEIKRRSPEAPELTVAEVLKWPGVIQIDEEPGEELSEALIQSLEDTLGDLIRDRHREGRLVEEILQEQLQQFKSGSVKARGLIPEAQARFQERMREKLAELDVEVDPARWEQEVGLMLTKLDVAEEIDRIDLHVAEFERVLAEDSVVGKRLGFLLQELVREVNTLGSKTLHHPLSSLSVDLKVTLEQMREQIQNVE